jgi:dodecin
VSCRTASARRLDLGTVGYVRLTSTAEEERTMSVARVSEISARSDQSFEDAVRIGIERASQTLRNLRSAWIKEQEVTLDPDGRITGYEVTMKVTFVLDEG